MVERSRIYRIVEFCSGCGGLSTGFVQAGFEAVLLNDIEKSCCDSLRKNHGNHSKILHKDMNTINGEDIVDCVNIDVVAAGIPCQPFSHAGNREGVDDDRGKIFQVLAQLIQKIKPKVFLVENVKGLLTINNGETFNYIIQALNSENKYNVQYKLLNAVDYEVPQKRERVFIIGTHKDLPNNFTFPQQSLNKKVMRDVLENCPNSAGQRYHEEKKKMMEKIPQGGCWINLTEEEQKQYLGNSYNSGGGKRGIARRLHLDQPSLTLTTSPQQKQTERCHPIETRPLTVREYARVQTFPDSYEFCGTMNQQYKQIGNAVPVKLAEFVANSIKAYLNQITYPIDEIRDDSSQSEVIDQIQSVEDKQTSLITIQTIVQQHLDQSRQFENTLNDIVLNDFVTQNPQLFVMISKIKYLQMKIGAIWQDILGSQDGYRSLNVGHETGLDIINEQQQVIMELKNSYNTDNSSSKHRNFEKLCEFKQKHPNYTIIYGVINCNTQNNVGKREQLKFKDLHITYLSGNQLLEYILGDQFQDIVQIVKKEINTFLCR